MSSVSISDFLYLGPTGVLVVTGLFLVLVEGAALGRQRELVAGLGVVGTLGAIASAIWLLQSPPAADSELIFNGMLVCDRLSMTFGALFSLIALLTILCSMPHQSAFGWGSGEYYAMLLLATSGMTMLASAADLIVVFLGVETMSIATYVLTAARRGSRRSSEAAMKYFLMGAFATGFLLYGIALLYGATGTTSLEAIRFSIAENASDPLLVVAVFFLIIGFGFKIAAVPFHMWTPDVYEGAPTPVTGFMAAGVKAAAFAGIIRVFGESLGGEIIPYGRMGWAGIFAALAALTMTVGNIAALKQQSIKRMLAYSSVSHAGVLLVGVVAMGLGAAKPAQEAILYYLAAYSATTVGAFGVIAWLGSKGHERTRVDDWSGLAQKHPLAALAMTVFMLSFGGLPPTAGFFGKFLVFKSAMQAHDQQLVWLVVVGVVNSMISIFYYLRVVTAMYFRDPAGDFQPTRAGSYTLALGICVLLVLYMGLVPGHWLSAMGG